MPALTRRERLAILYDMFRRPSESGGKIYQLSLSTRGSGLAFGVNQIDLSRTPLAGELIASIAAYINAHHEKDLEKLPYSEGDLSARLGVDNKAVLTAITCHPTMAAFFASDEGRCWVDTMTGSRVGRDLDVVVAALGSGPLAQRLVDDPVALTLLMEVKNNHGNLVAFARLVREGTTVWGDGTSAALTPEQRSGEVSLSLAEIATLLAKEYPAGQAAQAAKLGGQFLSDAKAVAATLETGTLADPPLAFLTAARASAE